MTFVSSRGSDTTVACVKVTAGGLRVRPSSAEMCSGCVHRCQTAALWRWCPNRRRHTTSHLQPACPAPPSADMVSHAAASKIPTHRVNEALVGCCVYLLRGCCHANVFLMTLSHIKCSFFFPRVASARTNLKSLSSKQWAVSAQSCSEPFLSPTVCAAGCFTVDVQPLLGGARVDRTDSERNEHEGETRLLFDSTHDVAGIKMHPVLQAPVPSHLSPLVQHTYL